MQLVYMMFALFHSHGLAMFVLRAVFVHFHH